MKKYKNIIKILIVGLTAVLALSIYNESDFCEQLTGNQFGIHYKK